MTYTGIVKSLKDHTLLLKSLGVTVPGMGVLLTSEAWCQKQLETLIGSIGIFRIAVTTLSICLGLCTYIWLKRPKFIEHCGAHFKKNKPTYHYSVYCGDPKCLLPTHVDSDNFYKCKCGWKSAFSTDEIPKIASELPTP